MTVEIVKSQHLKVVFDDPSAWTLWMSYAGDTIELGLHWNNRDIPSSTKTLVEGTKEYNTFREFMSAKTNS